MVCAIQPVFLNDGSRLWHVPNRCPSILSLSPRTISSRNRRLDSRRCTAARRTSSRKRSDCGLTKNRNYSLFQGEPEDIKDVSEYLKDLFQNHYASFLLNFGL